ncbi:MAG TPA: peptidoglycan recognition family protein [Thermoanaerobaculia bacterium]|nr:peptidoglycan recognition family protein [Thermoanaerobaculia bacterium]
MKKWHVQYKEYPGWTTRHRPGAFSDIRGIVIHHTGSDAQSDSYLDWIFTQGRASEGIPAPLCHVSTDFDGDVHLGALGRANHAGKGSSATLAKVTLEQWPGLTQETKPGPDNTDGNAHFYGNEVRYDGGQPMTAQQYASAVRWAAAICDHYGWSAMSVIGHREWSSRKNDPGKCPMNKFRFDVDRLLKAGPPGAAKPSTSTQETDMALTDADVAKILDTPLQPGGADVTLRSAGLQIHWLYQGFLQGGKFEQLLQKAATAQLLAPGQDINNQLDRIEADTDRIQ